MTFRGEVTQSIDSKVIELITSESMNRVKKCLDSLVEEKSVIKLMASMMFGELVLAFCTRGLWRLPFSLTQQWLLDGQPHQNDHGTDPVWPTTRFCNSLSAS